MKINNDVSEDVSIDVKIGQAIKGLRTMRGYTRDEVAIALSISHQQLAKYESGTNRIAAGKLYALAKMFNVSSDYFFAEIEGEQVKNRVSIPQKEQMNFARNFAKIKDKKKRNIVKALVQILAE
ncbi:MAG: hypothetical protein COV36_04170 [Alphaproteobacteria bacterium CG11_big_fil_rev_8_21_14_0_20_44_7]|nr:MAG: hypothetical protein COV36_04170 [Alphaproteobacteria bacterium CG11_big_fil_rev_8_21_14_0_20_44_7]